MKKKLVWVILSFLMVSSLILASCAPTIPTTPTTLMTPTTPATSTTPTTPTKPTVTAGPEMVRDSLGRLVEKPSYGGKLTLCATGGVLPLGFDDAFHLPWLTGGSHMTNEKLLVGDWTRGPAGTGEFTWFMNWTPPVDGWVGCVAERWELADPQTIIYHIRKGVHFALDPKSEASRLVGGRELVADDVVFTIERLFKTPTAYLHGAFLEWQRPLSVTAPDKYTVVMKCPPGMTGDLLAATAELSPIVAPEVIKKYRDMQDWRNVVGTGPFILTNYLPMSSMTLLRNPNYWQRDPLLPENQLPYIDSVKILYIPDMSTVLAATRTAKIDTISLDWEAVAQLHKTSPELNEAQFVGYSTPVIHMRTDKEPFNDIRVRKALTMAIDRQAIVNEYYNGNATILAFPIMPVPEFKDIYVPLDDLPQSVREGYEYHPDKAKQLLAEAGYPDGFKTSVICTVDMVDSLSILGAYWADIGVDLKIDVKESAVYFSIRTGRIVDQMIFVQASLSLPFLLHYQRTGVVQNSGMISDQRVDETYEYCADHYFEPALRNQKMKDLVPYMLEQFWHFQWPSPHAYVLWQPWLKGYHGEQNMGRLATYIWPTYIWIDPDIKEEMTGRSSQ